MILHALTEYYGRLSKEGVVAPFGFKKVEIQFLITLNLKGEFVGLQDTRTQQGNRRVARVFMVPEERERSGSKAWQTTNLLWDHYGYVLAWPKGVGTENKEMAKKQHSTFVAEVEKLHERYSEDDEIKAVYKFLSSRDFSEVFASPLWSECTAIPGCKLSFLIEGHRRLVCENKNVKTYVTESSQADSDEEEEDKALQEMVATCLISGDEAPVARLHPRTPILGSKSNAKIVSFQKNMGFDSYGKQQNFNAPVSKKAAFSYTTVLNQMLAKNSRQKLGLGEDTAVFWAEEKNDLEDVFADLFGDQVKENPDQINQAIHSVFEAPQSGASPVEQDLTRFYVLGLAPNAARIAVRFWHAGTVGETAQKIRQYFKDFEIVHGPKYPKYLPLFRLLVSIAAREESKNIPSNLAGDIMKAILAGTPYPQTLLSAAVQRCRAEREVTYPRAAIIKAVLVRAARYFKQKEKEVEMALDTENSNIGYRLGRLFATLEKIQEEAQPGINATIRDRFYGSASGTPVVSFPRLLKLKNHHMSKLENKGRAINLEKIIGEIMSGVTDFPTHLNLQDQGRFAVGYYHQRQDFFTKKVQ